MQKEKPFKIPLNKWFLPCGMLCFFKVFIEGNRTLIWDDAAGNIGQENDDAFLLRPLSFNLKSATIWGSFP